VIAGVAGKACEVEITHADNHVKWGIWGAAEYRRLLDPV